MILTAEAGDYFPRLLSPFINRAVASNKWEAAKCQSQQLTNTAKTCDIYLMLGQFEKARSVLKVNRASYLRDNHFFSPSQRRYQASEPAFVTHEWTNTCTGGVTATPTGAHIKSVMQSRPLCVDCSYSQHTLHGAWMQLHGG